MIFITEISTHSLTRRLTVWICALWRFRLISTHSLTRRLTEDEALDPEVHRNFNSQPHKEADGRFKSVSHQRYKFQLTASQGGWQKNQDKWRMVKTFQLTASQGGWPGRPGRGRSGRKISTHSLTRRLTPGTTNQTEIRIFQLTASQGGWQS